MWSRLAEYPDDAAVAPSAGRVLSLKKNSVAGSLAKPPPGLPQTASQNVGYAAVGTRDETP